MCVCGGGVRVVYNHECNECNFVFNFYIFIYLFETCFFLTLIKAKPIRYCIELPVS